MCARPDIPSSAHLPARVSATPYTRAGDSKTPGPYRPPGWGCCIYLPTRFPINFVSQVQTPTAIVLLVIYERRATSLERKKTVPSPLFP